MGRDSSLCTKMGSRVSRFMQAALDDLCVPSAWDKTPADFKSRVFVHACVPLCSGMSVCVCVFWENIWILWESSSPRRKILGKYTRSKNFRVIPTRIYETRFYVLVRCNLKMLFDFILYNKIGWLYIIIVLNYIIIQIFL